VTFGPATPSPTAACSVPVAVEAGEQYTLIAMIEGPRSDRISHGGVGNVVVNNVAFSPSRLLRGAPTGRDVEDGQSADIYFISRKPRSRRLAPRTGCRGLCQARVSTCPSQSRWPRGAPGGEAGEGRRFQLQRTGRVALCDSTPRGARRQAPCCCCRPLTLLRSPACASGSVAGAASSTPRVA